MNKRLLRLLLISILLFLMSACASSPRFTNRNLDESNRGRNDEDLSKYDDYKVLETVYGVASFYADKYHGNITYGGEVYDMYGISAAHPSYQMNTIVRITNLSNDKSVILRINDKMPFRADRIIDLSYGTAVELDFVEQGLADIKLEVLEWGDGKK
ncbi:MAG: septal ring lytic transglycosylase RlpA family protein [Bacteroidota bacterium]